MVYVRAVFRDTIAHVNMDMMDLNVINVRLQISLLTYIGTYGFFSSENYICFYLFYFSKYRTCTDINAKMQ